MKRWSTDASIGSDTRYSPLVRRLHLQDKHLLAWIFWRIGL